MSRRVGEGRVCALSNLAARAFSFCLADSAVPTVGRQVRHHHAQRCRHRDRNPKFRLSVLISALYLGFLSPDGSTAGHAVNSVLSASCGSLISLSPAQFLLPIPRTAPHRDFCNRHASNIRKLPHIEECVGALEPVWAIVFSVGTCWSFTSKCYLVASY